MRVLLLANSDEGLYQFRNELIVTLLQDNEVFLGIPNGKYVEYFKGIGCNVENTNYDRHGINPFNELKIISRYKKMLKNIKPDIVFTYTIKPNIYGGIACSSLNIPYISNITGLGTAVENGGLLQIIALVLYKIGLKNAKKVFFQNSENKRFMIKKNVVKGPCDLLPGSGVNLSKYKVTEYPKGNVVNFLFVARLMKEKGIDIYLDAAIAIHKKYPNTLFHVCGSKEIEYDMTELNKLVKEGFVVYHGEVENIKDMYKMASCTIHPTYYPEGLSNVLLESCACARPIITTNRPGCREVVEDGVNGYIIKEKNCDDLIKKIEIFLNKDIEERKQMGIAGRKKVEREFNRTVVINKYLNEIESINI